jgi:hypothetical protein
MCASEVGGRVARVSRDPWKLKVFELADGLVV